MPIKFEIYIVCALMVVVNVLDSQDDQLPTIILLLYLLTETSRFQVPFYVRCIKPNARKSGGEWDEALVQHQVSLRKRYQP